MKTLTAILALWLIGCGHATTKMDRELALKLADKSPVIVTAPAPVINVNNYNGGQSSQPTVQQRDISSGDFEAVDRSAVDATGRAQENCVNSPVYNSAGDLVNTVRRCFGAR